MFARAALAAILGMPRTGAAPVAVLPRYPVGDSVADHLGTVPCHAHGPGIQQLARSLQAGVQRLDPVHPKRQDAVKIATARQVEANEASRRKLGKTTLNRVGVEPGGLGQSVWFDPVLPV